MKHLRGLCLLLILVLLTGCSAGGKAHQPEGTDAPAYRGVHFEYQADQIRKIEINWVGGLVELEHSDQATLSVTENSQDLPAEQQMSCWLDGDELKIDFCAPTCTASIDATRKSLLVQLPVGIELEVNTVSADVRAAELKIQTLEADLTSGSLSVDALTAHDADLETVSGNIDLKNTAIDKKLDIGTTSGSITLLLRQCPELELNAVSGSADVSLLEGLAAQVDFSTTSGRLDNTVPADGAEVCRIDAESVSGGLTVRPVSALPAMD